jgi:glycyl-tRNA synthetase
MDFQNIVMQLNNFWSKHGCCIVAADDTEKGAGTFSHHTFLRSLGPEPCNIAHIDPSRRPKDGRYGENPNRLQLFHQYQVLLKPAPENIIQLFLDSLEAIGLSQKDHDIRFVQDDWESPTLGAWGLGWEVWCDGMEITQFTYFQSVAGIEMEVIPVEIAYGLERLSMFINHKSSIYEVPFGGVYSYKDLFHLREVQSSRYNLEEATGDLWFRLFDLYSDEVKRLNALDLAIPAYEFVNKASHAFNMLDARGLISVTERQSYILRVRELAALTAKTYLNTRKSMDFPLVKYLPKPVATNSLDRIVHHPTSTHEDFLLEIFTEDLPAHYVPHMIRELEKQMQQFLLDAKIGFGGIESYSTHKRLVLIVREMAQTTTPFTQVKKGPSLTALYDAQNHPTAVAKSFFNSLGKPVLHSAALHESSDSDLSVEAGYVMVKKTIPSQDTLTLLQEGIPAIISKIKTPKSMRWNSTNIAFARPIRSLICLYGDKNVPVEYANVQSGKWTYGHRQRSNKKIAIHNVDEYLDKLKENFVIVDRSARQEMILGALPEGAHGVDRLINELVYLSEYPVVGEIHFDATFLELPAQLIELEMIVHQRYFPVYENGKITNKAYVVLDVPVSAHILENNKRVLRARLSDGAFFLSEDKKMGLEPMRAKLDKVIFQKDLGTYQAKIDRMLLIATELKDRIGGHQTDVIDAIRYCKADLNSNVVGEFPELQGLMGSMYARFMGCGKAVVEGIEQHYLPQQENDPLPSSFVGLVVSLIDKLDNILAFSSVNLLATSSKDPYAQRRQALCIIKILNQLGWDLDISALIDQLYANYPMTPTKEKNSKEPIHLIKSRLKTVLLDLGFTKEEIEAVTSVTQVNVPKIFATANELRSLQTNAAAFKEFLEVYRRVKGQAVDYAQKVEPQLFTTAEESELYQSLKELRSEPSLTELLDLKPKIDKLFDHVHINDPDVSLKKNRQQMLYESTQYFEKRLHPSPLLALL